MDIVKKNILSIIAGVVALLALVAWIWPLGSIKAQAESKLKSRADVGSQMQQVLSSQRTLPVVSLQGEATAAPLGTFPTQQVIDWGKDLTGKLANEAKDVKLIATRINERKLLVANSLPVPAPTTEFAFRDVYLRYVQDFPKLVKAGTPPTSADIEAAAQDLWKTKYQPTVQGQDPSSNQQAQAEFAKERLDLPEQVRSQRARSILFYMDPQALDVSTSFASGATGGGAMGGGNASAPTPLMIWDAQLKVWVQNDIVQAIVDINARNNPSMSVVDAPVKQLLKITIEPMRGASAVTAGGTAGSMGGYPGMMGGPPGMGGAMGGPPGMMGGAGGYPGMMGASGAGGAVKAVESPTGRTANSVYDVVPFRLVVHVDADKLPQFLQELGRDRFITACNVSLKAVDSVILGYQYNVMYGPAPVVEATISGESLLLRDWTVQYMPAEIKASLQITDGAAGAAAGVPGAGSGMPGGPMGR